MVKLTKQHFLAHRFEKDFREYMNASVAFAMVQDPIEAVSSEDEIKWIKDWIIKEVPRMYTKDLNKK